MRRRQDDVDPTQALPSEYRYNLCYNVRYEYYLKADYSRKFRRDRFA